jgi:hypothetical protein
VVLATSLTHSALGAFVAYQLPLGIFMASAGMLIFRGAHPDLRATAPPAASGTARRALRATSSIWVIMIVWAAASGALMAAPQVLRP